MKVPTYKTKPSFFAVAILITSVLTSIYLLHHSTSSNQLQHHSNSLLNTQTHAHIESLSYQNAIQAPIEAAINSPMSGTIRKVFIPYGQKVKAQVPLAILYSPESKKQFNAQLIAYLKNKDQLQLTQEKNQQDEVLYADGIIPYEEIKKVKNQLHSQTIEFLQIENAMKELCSYFDIPFKEVHSLSFSQTQAVQNLLEKPAEIVLKTPADGILLMPNMQEKKNEKSTLIPGSKVDADNMLAIIGKPDLLELNLNVPETDIHRIQQGQEVEIRPVSNHNLAILGKVTLVDRYNLSPGSREDIAYFPVTIQADCPSTTCPLQAGMTAEVNIILQKNRAIAVPASAIYHQLGKNFVLVRDQNDSQSQREVEVIRTDVEGVLIQTPLAEGESIVRDYPMP